MARIFLCPTSTCCLVGASAAQVQGYVWLGIAAASDTSACCAFYAGSNTDGDHIWTFTATSGHLIPAAMNGPWKISTSLVYAQLTGTRASALIATASY